MSTNLWAGIRVESNLILKIWWKNPLVGKLFQLYGNFLPHLYHKLGCEIYIEEILDGALIFYKNIADFIRFHQAAEFFSIPESPRDRSPYEKIDEVEFYVDLVKLPPNVTIDDLLPGVAKSYQIISKKITVEKLSESSAVIHYHDAYTIGAIFEYMKEIWSQNGGSGKKTNPKSEEIAHLFDNILDPKS